MGPDFAGVLTGVAIAVVLAFMVGGWLELILVHHLAGWPFGRSMLPLNVAVWLSLLFVAIGGVALAALFVWYLLEL